MYELFWLHPKQLTKTFYHEEFEYRFRDDSKLIYFTGQNDHNINFTNSHSYFSSKTNLNVGENELFRIDDLYIIVGGDVNKEETLNYTGDSIVNIDNKDYNVNIFEGNITDISGCGV